MESLINALATLLRRYPKALAAGLLPVVLFSAAGYLFPRDPWPSFLADRKNSEMASELETLDQVKSDFDLRRSDCFLVLQGDDLLAAEHVIAIREMRADLETLALVDSVFWIDDIPILNVFGLADPLLPPSDASEQSFEEAAPRVLEHPLVGGQLLSEDANTIMLPVSLNWIAIESDDDIAVAIGERAKESFRESGVRLDVKLTGDAPLMLAQMDAYRRNQRKFQLIAYCLVFLFAAALFRGVAPILIVAAAPMLAIFVTFGLFRWFGVSANPLTDAVMPVLVALLGVTDGVHLMHHIRLSRSKGASAIDAVVSGLREVGTACILTSLTTAVGFISLLVAQSEFVRAFGRACSFGVIVTLVFVLTVIPLLALTRLGAKLHQGLERDLIVGNIGRLGPLIDGIMRFRRLVALLGILVTIGFSVVGLWMRPDSRLASSLPSASEAAQALATADRELGGIELARLVVEWPREVDWSSEQVLSAVRDAQRIVDQEPTLSNTISVLDIIDTFPGDDRYPERKVGMLELMPSQLRDRLIRRDQRRALISFRAQDLGVGRYERIFREMDSELAQLEQKYPGFRFALTGDVVVRGRRIYQIVEDLARSLVVATAIIFAVMAFAFRSLRLGLISLIPNLFPLATTAFMLVIFDQPLNVSTVCAFTVCLGMAVDDTIHFLNRFQRLRSKGVGVESAIRDGFLQVGSALIMTTLVLLVGFSTVMTSELPSQRTFATMACATIAAALFGDMIFLPALLAWFVKERPTSNES